VKKHCDFTVAIPQTGPVGSLNASAAAAVIIYEAFRQRRS
jgi:23S rRNA (guanosine2251-2'-O)-methyltransferase